MKKFLNALLIFALVFTMAVPAFAAVPSDVKGTDAEEAVAKLSALGVLSGYPDGTFRPDNNITRAEFAKIVAYAAGFATAAEYLGASNTQFSDVKADNWASGYIAVAANKGYLKGYPDGTFKPNNNVTYAEVVTVLLRVLGYNDNLIGSWPSNYIIQADDLDLLDDVKFSASKPATRGDVAVLTSGTLEKNIRTYDKDTDDFEDTGKKLISKAFATSFKDAVVLEPKLVGDDEDQISLLVNGVEKKYTAGDLDVSLAALWGHEVEFLLDDDLNVVYINDVQSDDDVVTGDADEDVTVVDSVYVVTVDDEEYDFASDAVVKLNNKSAAEDDIKEGAAVKLFLDDERDVRFVIATKYTGTSERIVSLSKVSTSGTAYIEKAVGNVKVDVDDTEFTLNGEPASYDDLEEDMIFNYVLDGGVATMVDATDDVVTGEVEGRSSKGTVTVDGTKYDLVTASDYSSFIIGDEYKLFLNADGEVAYFESVDGAGSGDIFFFAEYDKYLPIVDGRTADEEVEDAILLADNGNAVTYTAAAKNVIGYTYEGNLVKITLNSDDEVTTAELQTISEETEIVDISTSTKRITFKDKNTLRYTSDTVVFDATNYFATGADEEVDEVEVIDFADLEEGWKVKYLSLSGDPANAYYVDYIVVTDNDSATSKQEDPVVGIFVEAYDETDADDTYHYVTLNVEGEELDFEVESSLSTSGIAEGDLVVLTDLTSDYGLFDNISEAVDATGFADDKLTTDSGNVVVTPATVIYEVTMDGTSIDEVDLASDVDIEEAFKDNYDVKVLSLVDADGKVIPLGADEEASAVIIIKK